MTVRHEHQEYASKTSQKTFTVLLLAIISTLCGVMLWSINRSDDAIEKVYLIDAKIESHMTQYDYVKQSIEEAKILDIRVEEKLDSQSILIHQQLIGQENQGKKLDDIEKKLDGHLTKFDVVGSRSPDPGG